ncbi:8573_t:CDS:2, partial [Racocetra persica]
IIEGCRPEILTNTPSQFVELMEKCWNADPSKRPTADELLNEISYKYEKSLKFPEISHIQIISEQHEQAIYTSRPLKCLIKTALNSLNKRDREALTSLNTNSLRTSTYDSQEILLDIMNDEA